MVFVRRILGLFSAAIYSIQAFAALTSNKQHQLLRCRLQHGANIITPRIVGGYNTTRGRFPYYTGLWDPARARIRCGGSLIAPDVVLTAAHCWLGPEEAYIALVHKYYYQDLGDDYEPFEIVRYIPHPYFGVEADVSSDFMLLILNGTALTDTPPVKINRDGTIPIANQNMTAIGLGVTKVFFASYEFPSVLQGVTLTSIPNDVCSRSCSLNVLDQVTTYQGLITDDSLCAWQLDASACYSDSGGPLLLLGSSPERDVQVGIVSWGVGCASDVFPGVFARVSEAAEWIDSNVCKYSKDPPAWFNCRNRTFPPDLVIPTNPDLPGNTYPISVEIELDSTPSETWWFILNSTGHLIYMVPRYTYGVNYTYEKAIQILHLPIGQTYTFVIKDEGEDGISDGGGYTVRLADNMNGTVLVSNFNFYGTENRTKFELSSSLTVSPTAFPTSSRAPSISPAPTLSLGVVTLTIHFGDRSYPEHFGYKILNEDNEDLVDVPVGYFGDDNITVETVIQLPKDENYTFVIMSDGLPLNGGDFCLVLGPPDSGGPILLFSNATFTGASSNRSSDSYFEERLPFYIPIRFTPVPSFAPSRYPSWTPTMTMRPTGPQQALTLTIHFREHNPAYFGYVVLDSRNRSVINEKYGTFSKTIDSVERMLYVPSEQEYTFILSNEYGYYLYPGNFSIILGLPDERGPVLAPLNFSSTKSDVKNNTLDDDFTSLDDDRYSSSFDDYIVVTFFVPSRFTSTPSMAPTLTLPVTLDIDFASYPSEIAYRLYDENKKEDIVYAPFGTYGFAKKTIEQVYNLPVGTKVQFTIYDYFGDGRFPGRFTLTVGTPGFGGKIIVSKVGINGFKEVYPFCIEYSPTTSPKPSVRPSPEPSTGPNPNTKVPKEIPSIGPSPEPSTGPNPKSEVPNEIRSTRPSSEPSLVRSTAPPSAMSAPDRPTAKPTFVIPATSAPVVATSFSPSRTSTNSSNGTVAPTMRVVPSAATNRPTRVQKLQKKDARHSVINKTSTGRGKRSDFRNATRNKLGKGSGR